ncbi:hypothetical protein COV13_01600 [Candidatus Woesearchaeota archaeon CG10_big_fil_rev_8_21_14_0_10_32_9]|nr:MAG: hypothetical protein COV13_01600 [Candidatus Woesearchaeota archaeon CG10_big_fil_rev_8_21_14_0_10_32_9]
MDKSNKPNKSHKSVQGSKENKKDTPILSESSVFKVKGDSTNSEKKEEKQSKKKSSKHSLLLKMGIPVGIIIILAIVYLLVSTNKPAQVDYSQYNGYYFNKTSDLGLWRTTLKTGVGDVVYDFYYHPLDVENISYNNSLSLYIIVVAKNNGNFTVAYSPELSGFGKAAIAGTEVTKVIGTYINVNSGFTEALPGYPDLPIHNCSESGPRVHVLEFSLGEKNEIISDQYCSKIIGTDLDNLIMLADAYIYRVMGIIKDPVIIDPNKLNVTSLLNKLNNTELLNSSLTNITSDNSSS